MQIDFFAEAAALAPELTALRHAIHRHPELGNQEFETTRQVETYLQRCGLETFRPLPTAVVGILRGNGAEKNAPCAALRADMDALPLQERSGAPFASETPGVMHACGHDVHTAAALGAARLLSAHRAALCGEVRFLFQPDEEGSGGAQRMIDAECMDGVGAVFGAHVSPALPAGTVGVRYGKFYAASDTFSAAVLGKSAHGATREAGVDALAAAARMVTAVLALPDVFLPERSVVSVGTLHAGTAGNILADRAELSGILRTLGADTRAEMKRRFRQTLEKIAVETGTQLELHLHESYGGIVNTEAETRLVQETAAALLGAAQVRVLDEPTMTTEDFGCLIDAAGRGCFYHVGAGCTCPLHSPDFLPDDSAVVTAAALHAAVLATHLSRATSRQ